MIHFFFIMNKEKNKVTIHLLYVLNISKVNFIYKKKIYNLKRWIFLIYIKLILSI